MRVKLGEHLLTKDGQDAGVVDKVIMDPNSGEVTTVVVRRGGLLHHDVEVALNQIVSGPDGQPRVDLAADALADLPAFEEANYTTIPAAVNVPSEYPGATALWPLASTPMSFGGEPPPYGGRAVQEEVATQLYTADLNNAVIQSGSAVYSKEGHKVGEVERLAFDTDGRLLRVIVRQGFLFSREFALDGRLVDGAADGKIYLNIDRQRVEELVRSS